MFFTVFSDPTKVNAGPGHVAGGKGQRPDRYKTRTLGRSPFREKNAASRLEHLFMLILATLQLLT